ncbi:SWI/SNF-related matrix-associated actin-dependent regulator of chromatin subfamily A containing DEAD/H box 1 homolog [Neocloeon triangulifer]|uniref:SWI/SNF-related matrix-associated actin-dependent regulator of chromatin subfamily A containing DEAD/H box 1 homolog n=1 Tax=Neocloeon triangulifer TaxID=2078957 RepID=UPI00286F2B2D|nr:SWI/SNF-related matrix-associated actin-dependent regulator of chromatin subfamily A containing DEAD/H box 1 homolog [Neocloeon triangulifer]
MEPKTTVNLNGKPVIITGFLKKFEHKPGQKVIIIDRATGMKRMLENGAAKKDGEPSEKKDKTDCDEAENSGAKSDTPADQTSAEINILFLHSMNPLLDKMEVQDALARCEWNAVKAGRILKSMNEERKEKREQERKQNEKEELEVLDEPQSPESPEPKKYRRISTTPQVKTKEEYRRNEELFAKMCTKFPLRDRMFIQQCLVQANWLEELAATLIRAGPKNARPVPLSDTEKELVRKQQEIDAEEKKRREAEIALKKQQQQASVKMKPLTPSEINKAINASFKNITSQKCSPEEEDDETEPDYRGDFKKRTLDMLKTITLAELATLPGFSKKKAETVIRTKPYEMWGDIRGKLERPVANSLIKCAEEMFRVRDDVTELMQQCTRLSKQMAGKVRQIVSSNASDLAEQPNTLGGTDLKLAPYQLVGLNWLILLHKHGINGILADEMGLGKTIQVIAFLAYLKEQELKKGAHAIVVPASTFENWSNELARWCPNLNVINYSGSQEERKHFRLWWKNDKNKEEVDTYDIILTTYNQIGSNKLDRAFYRNINLHYIIYDEAHMLKNMATQRYAALMQIQAERRILLTGTPLQNNLIELMSLLIFVMPQMLGERQEELTTLFKMANRPDGCNEFEKQKIQQAKKIMEPFVLRRLKKDVLKDLPSKTNHVVNIDLTSHQKDLYKNLVMEFFSNATKDDTPPPSEVQSENGDDLEQQEVEEPEPDIANTQESSTLGGSMSVMMLMRRAANHPALLRHHYDDRLVKKMAKKLLKDKTYKENREESIRLDLMEMSDHQIHQLCRNHPCIEKDVLSEQQILESGKFNELDKLLPELQKGGHRVLMFSQFTQMMDILEDYLNIRGLRYFRLDGQTPVAERQGMVDEFNSDESIFIFMLSTRAGGLGINLTAADTVIIHDIDLNPYNDKQAEDRCHRVGQTRPVTIYKMVAKNTIEDAMYMVAQNKLTLEQEISGGSSGGKQNEKKLYHLLKEALMASGETS